MKDTGNAIRKQLKTGMAQRVCHFTLACGWSENDDYKQMIQPQAAMK